MQAKSWSRAIGLVATLVSLSVFAWPLFITQESQTAMAQGVFIGLMPILVIIVLAEYGSGSLGSRQLAVLGLLIALNASIRLLGAGVAGVETAFFLIIIAGYVFGMGFGFTLGAGSLLVSALLGAGVGPWLPFQMMAAGLVGIGAGGVGNLTLRMKSRAAFEIAILCAYAIPASFGYGALMTLWNWPFLAGEGSSLSFVAGAPPLVNLATFIKYEFFTGGLLWDLGRTLTTAILLALTAKTLLATLRRAANKAGIHRS
jgi:energy-coupling factor transport system substrate-specific component